MAASRPAPRRLRRPPRDRGQVAIEFLGFLPILLVVALATVQLGIAAYGAQQAGTAARAAARAASLDDRADAPAPTPQAAAEAATSDWLDVAVASSGGAGEVRATATVTIPSVIPGIPDMTATRSATMPLPAEPAAAGS
ncbi:TadE/TadG family type IV pilus assembly protein [Streptomyces sp. URMC 123]|uniref:TadE/TadG family type IV pilus assembly protein n=1 Tax=Streptomyces sp. URMC 123 TaxID=3423403 RepID=UPI003F1AE2D2